MTITLKQLLLVLGGILLAIGIILGFMPVKASGVHCGSALTGKSDDAFTADFRDSLGGGPNADGSLGLSPHGDACDESISSRRTISLALGIPGLLLVAGSAFVKTPEPSNP